MSHRANLTPVMQWGRTHSLIWIRKQFRLMDTLTSVLTLCLQEECNVICVDWESGAIIPNYVRAAANTRLVGKQLAMLVRGLQDHVGLRLENVHLIGFSLGAHVAGFAGAELKNISRITGTSFFFLLFNNCLLPAKAWTQLDHYSKARIRELGWIQLTQFSSMSSTPTARI